ncbi:transcriptional regulator [Bacillus thuringiensis]|uniref:helix-turn-helix domain-containing protein n=1 Tax=Bacillus thuringiensis TaxID=1428 RepID=UPI000BEE7B5F|nr:helix-turn-helix transcriptional regulator [Bacillus thuringiensis]MED3526387.1 helix-turn-helix transcriptional regulator [Bacillus thuringiensis]PEA57656.1 transcriptional regulator [Bacillus thuringiensis]PEE98530.1 transcriptional regulator [Bacillus thuringiensis]PFW11174.1 transcriptional regulator [Bacillus thuringiensis]
MNIGKQIQYFRKRDNMSQEKLAEKIHVSRQSISNWENERNYPDIHNLLMMSILFNVSLDDLVKGDVKIMKEELQKSAFFKWSYIMLASMIILLISIAPVFYFFGYYGLIIPVVLTILLMFSLQQVENIKKEHNLKTYRQIVDFIEGKPVSEVKPNIKDKLLKIGLMLASALISYSLIYLGLSVFGR